VNILREAYVKSINNPEPIAEARKTRMDMEPVSGEQLQALAKRVMNQPPPCSNASEKFLNRKLSLEADRQVPSQAAKPNASQKIRPTS
jgi:hypothetical protein